MAKTDATKSFSEILMGLIIESKMEYRPLAKAIGISQASLSKYAANDAEPGITALVKLAEYFNVSIDYLAGRTDVRSPKPEMQAAVEFTGLSEQAVKKLQEFNPIDSPGRRTTSDVASFILTSDEFDWFAGAVIIAQDCNYLLAHKTALEMIPELEGWEKFRHYFDLWANSPQSAITSLEERVELEEFHAIRSMSVIVADLCAHASAGIATMKWVEEHTKAGEPNAED